jgi:NTE family protein
VEFVARLIDHGRPKRGTGPGEYRRINAHRIVLGENEKTYSADTKPSTDYDFFRMLYTGGCAAARHFLDDHFDDIGQRSTFDLKAEAQVEWA